MAGNYGRRILLVDDDKDLLDLLKYNFQTEGFEVQTVSKAGIAIDEARRVRPALIVLDVLMPDGNGLDLCKEIRSLSCFASTVIFFLSAGSAISYCEEALRIGADDYIEKLSGLRALTGKVNAVLKSKFVIRKGVRTLHAGGLTIQKESGSVFLGGRQIVVSRPELEILFFLMQNANKTVSQANLVKIIWGSEIYVTASSVHVYIESLQRKFGVNVVETVPHSGYRFNDVH